MSTIEVHLSRSERLRAAADELRDATEARDWEIVTRFYSAVHLIQAFLLSQDPAVVVRSHDQRGVALRRQKKRLGPQHRHIMAGHDRLRSLSEQVRYVPQFVAQSKHLTLSRDSLSVINDVLRPMITPQSESSTGTG